MHGGQIKMGRGDTRWDEFAWVRGRPAVTGILRGVPEDFRVEEVLGFEPSGEGEHVFLRVRKRNTNTEWLARRLAALAGVRAGDIGYAGLKDRRAVASQWFSVHLPGKAEPDWRALESEDIQLLEVSRHHRKLRRGALRANRFEILVRRLHGDRDCLRGELERVAREGVPNYFGEQRFGRDGSNLARAEALLAGTLRRVSRHQRGLILSAARSWLFNRVLSRRLGEETWNQALPGEALVLSGCRSLFVVDKVDKAIRKRISTMDVHPSGPLWGRGGSLVRGRCRRLEEEILAPFEIWCTGLEAAGLKQERRSLRLQVLELEWELLSDGNLCLVFGLERGSYATSVLREVVNYEVGVDGGSGVI